jgi:DNA-binding transcriptional MerR regulator
MTTMPPDQPTVRIGELSRRVGVSVEVLRAWQQRYGVLEPARSPSGYRLYGPEDERRARRMKQLIEEGLAPAEAARAISGGALDAGPVPPWTGGRLADVRFGLRQALLAFDAGTAHERLDHLLDAHTVDVLLRDVVLPVLHDIGHGWQRNEISIAQEHFAAELLAGRLRSLGRRWDEGLGPRVLLGCPGGERHDLGLLCCALSLHQRGWRVTYLGADTPAHALEETVERIRPDLTVVSAVVPEPLHRVAGTLAALSGRTAVAVGGAGAHPAIALRAGARLLRDDPVTAARQLTAAHAG